jgi:hypothetical protein
MSLISPQNYLSSSIVRYKVRTEIALKQKAVEPKLLPLPSGSMTFNGTNAASSSGLSVALEKALTTGNVNADQSTDEVTRLRQRLVDEETKWRLAYEKLAKEHETLKTKGADSVVAVQWRLRYETSIKDKEELLQKLDLLMQLSNEVTSTGVPIEQLFLDVQDDYKVRFDCRSFALVSKHFSNLPIEFAEAIA